jgi:hypothetical protein
MAQQDDADFVVELGEPFSEDGVQPFRLLYFVGGRSVFVVVVGAMALAYKDDLVLGRCQELSEPVDSFGDLVGISGELVMMKPDGIPCMEDARAGWNKVVEIVF